MAIVSKRTRAIIFGVIALAVIVAIGVLIFETLQGVTVKDATELGQQACDAGQKIKNAAAYDGSKSQEMFLGVESPVVQQKPNLTDYGTATFQSPTTYTPDNLKTLETTRKLDSLMQRGADDIPKIALIGCVTRTHEESAHKTCKFNTGTLDVYKATYELKVYEAKTHKLIKTATIPSISEADFTCPTSIYYSQSAKREYIPMVSEALMKEVSPLTNV